MNARNSVVVSLLILLLGATGCVTPVRSISGHTLKVDEQSEKDVVWLVRGQTEVFRCDAAGGQPVCKRVTLP